jgi:hypothetical protein
MSSAPARAASRARAQAFSTVAPALLGQAVEGRERVRVGRLDLEGFPIVLRCGIGLVEHVFLERRELQEHRVALEGIFGMREPMRVEPAQIGRAVLGAVETIEDGDGLVVLRVGLENLLQLLDALVALAEALTGDGGQLATKTELLVRRRLLDASEIERDQRLVGARRVGCAVEAPLHLLVGRRELVGPARPAESALGVVHLLE